MRNSNTVIANQHVNGSLHHGLPTTITTASNSVGSGQVVSIANGGTLNSAFTFANPKPSGTISLNSSDGSETADFDAAFINDLKLLLEVINELPDEHPLGELKHDMRMRRAFKRLGG